MLMASTENISHDPISHLDLSDLANVPLASSTEAADSPSVPGRASEMQQKEVKPMLQDEVSAPTEDAPSTGLTGTEAPDFAGFIKSLSAKEANELGSLASDIRALIKSGDTTYKKVVNTADTIDYKLDEARKIFGEKNGHLFEAWKAAEFSGLTTSRAYELRSIATGKKTIQQVREETRQRQLKINGQPLTTGQIEATSKGAKAAIDSVSGAADPQGYAKGVLAAGNDGDAAASAAARKAAYDDAPAEQTPAEPATPKLTPQEISDDTLTAFKSWLGEHGHRWTPDDYRKARVYLSEGKRWLPKDRWKAMGVLKA
jgi:hypothetical protein